MKSIIIVDDELTIRKGIADFLNGQGKYQILDTCKNGKEAYFSILKNNPDIVITDVKMPVMDGLMLIEKCKELKTKYLILSGYDEFDYMKKAHLLNVEDYLLKPINNYELLNALDEISKKIDENEKEDAFNKNLLGHLLVEDTYLSPQVYHALKNKYHIDNSSLQILLFSFDTANCDMPDPMIRMKEYMERYLLQTIKSNFLVFIKKEKIVLLTSKSNIEENNIPLFLKSMIQKMKSEFNVSLAVGVSLPFNETMSFELLYYHTVLALIKKIYEPDKSILFQNILWQDIDEKELRLIYSKEKDQLIECLQKYKMEESKGVIKEILRKLSDDRIPPHAIFILIKDLKLLFQKLSAGQNMDSGFMNLDTDIEKVSANIFMYSKIKMEEIICHAIEELGSLFIDKNRKTDNIIDDVINYIHVYYMEDITLDAICRNFYINASYFSKIFKERIGMNYKKYLTDVRIRKSKNLLSLTNLKVYEISKIVGYNDPKYFSKVFKENTNMSPEDYKKNVQIAKD